MHHHTQKIFIFLETPKSIEIQNFDPPKNDPSLCMYENIRVPPPPPGISGPEVVKLEFILKLKIKSNDWLLLDKCLQAANHYALF